MPTYGGHIDVRGDPPGETFTNLLFNCQRPASKRESRSSSALKLLEMLDTAPEPNPVKSVSARMAAF